MTNILLFFMHGIYSLKFWGLREVLRDKYKLVDEDALSLADFLNSLLEVRQGGVADRRDQRDCVLFLLCALDMLCVVCHDIFESNSILCRTVD